MKNVVNWNPIQEKISLALRVDKSESFELRCMRSVNNVIAVLKANNLLNVYSGNLSVLLARVVRDWNIDVERGCCHLTLANAMYQTLSKSGLLK